MIDSHQTLTVTPEDRINELTAKLERAEYLMMEAARLIHQTAPPRVATRLLMRVRDYAGETRFKDEVLD